MEMAAFWLISPPSLIFLMMEAASAFCHTTRRYNPEDSHLHTRRRENLISHSLVSCYSCVEHILESSFPICPRRLWSSTLCCSGRKITPSVYRRYGYRRGERRRWPSDSTYGEISRYFLVYYRVWNCYDQAVEATRACVSTDSVS
jgi:hypothetical protein